MRALKAPALVAYIICGCGGMKMKKTEASVFVIEVTDDEGGSDATNPRPTEDDTRCTMDEERRPCPCCRVLRMGCAVM